FRPNRAAAAARRAARVSAVRAPAPHAQARVRPADRAMGVAEAPLARQAPYGRPLLRLPRGQARARTPLDALPRPLVVARPRDEDPRPRGGGLDRREVRPGAGVHDFLLPARLD